MSQDDQGDPAPQKMSLLTHLEELRKVIMVSRDRHAGDQRGGICLRRHFS